MANWFDQYKDNNQQSSNNNKAGGDWFDQYKDSNASALLPDPPKKEAGYNILGGIADVGKAFRDLPTQVKGAIGSLVEGGERPSANNGWEDAAIEQASQRTAQRQQELGAQANEKVLPFLTRGDISGLSQNLATSLTGMGAGLAAGLPAALVSTPVGGIVAGGAASGAAAYRMSQNQFIRQGLDAANQKALQTTGQGLTPEQEKAEYEKLTPLAQKYGAWEAVPEAISNMVGFGVGKAGVRAAKQGALKPLAKFMGVQLPTETGTEAITQMGQSNVEVDAGLSNEPKRDFTSPSDWWKSVKEVFPQTFMLTALMGGAGAIGTKMLGSKQDAETAINPTAEQPGTQPAEQLDAAGLTEKQVRDAARAQNPLSPFAHSSPIAEKQVIDKGNIVVFPDQDNEAVYPVVGRTEGGDVILGTGDFDENKNQITVTVPKETADKLLVVNTENWQSALESEQPDQNANLPFQATSGQLPVPVVPLTEQGNVDQNIPAINQVASPGRIDLLNPANNELATAKPVELPSAGSEFTRRSAPATMLDELNRLRPEQRNALDQMREDALIKTPVEQRTPAENAYLAMRKRERLAAQPAEAGLILPAEKRGPQVQQRIDLLQGKSNAEQITQTGEINGSSSAQPEVRQEGGGSAVSGQGLQPGRPGNEAAIQGNEAAQGQVILPESAKTSADFSAIGEAIKNNPNDDTLNRVGALLNIPSDSGIGAPDINRIASIAGYKSSKALSVEMQKAGASFTMRDAVNFINEKTQQKADLAKTSRQDKALVQSAIDAATKRAESKTATNEDMRLLGLISKRNVTLDTAGKFDKFSEESFIDKSSLTGDAAESFGIGKRANKDRAIQNRDYAKTLQKEIISAAKYIKPYEERVDGKYQSQERGTKVPQEEEQAPQAESNVVIGSSAGEVQAQEEVAHGGRWNALLVPEKEVVLRSIGYKPEVARKLSAKNWEDLSKAHQNKLVAAQLGQERADKAAEAKVAADKERSQFELTGSSRAADSNPRQADLTLRSEAVTKPAAGQHVTKIKDALQKALGTKQYDKLMVNADFGIIATAKELPQAVQDNIRRQGLNTDGVMGLWDNASDKGRSKIFLIAENIARPDDAYKVLLHEVGIHYGLPEILSPKLYKQIVGEIKAADQSGVKWARAIADLIRKIEPRTQTNEALLYEEVMAYLVQYSPDLRISERIISAIRQFLRRIGIVKGVKTADIVYLADGALQKAINGHNTFAISERSMDRLKGMVDTKRSYAGVYAELANTGNLQEAIKKQALGNDSEITRQETGWFKGPDGKWKFEISDNRASLKIKPEDMAIGRKYGLADILDHPELFDNYPDLLDVQIRTQLMFSNEKGSFDNKSKIIELNAELNPKKALSVLLHEIQHWIQYREDFATGGEPTIESLSNVIDKARPYFNSLMERSDKMLAERMASSSEAMRDSAMDYYRQNQKLVEAYDGLLIDVKSGKKTPAQLSSQADGSGVLFRIYEILAGEVEARDVQNRRNLTKEQRLQNAPYASEGVPAEQLVVKHGYGVTAFSRAIQTATEATRKERKGLRAKALELANKISSPLSGLENEDQYRLGRYLTMGTIGESMQRARGFFDAFTKASKEDSEAAYNFLTDKDAKPESIKDEAIRAKAIEAKALFRATGDVAVQMGLIPEESYEQLKDAYLPRIYLRHLLDEQARTSFQSTGKKPGLGFTKKRKDIPEHVRRLVYGEIKDPGFLVAQGIGNELKDISIIRWLNDIAKNPNWVLPNQLVKWEDHKVTPFWLVSEANTIRQIAVNYQGDRKTEALALADKMDQAGRAALPELPEIPDGWKKIPNNARYGKLRGLAVRRQIYDDIIGTVRVTEDQSVAEKILGDDGLAAKGTAFWKFMKVAANPASQVRNFISNLFMTHLFGGVHFHMILPRLAQAAKEMKSEGELYKYLMQYGGGSSSFASTELRRVNTEFLDALAKMDGKSWTQFRLGLGKIGNKLSDVYQNMETLSKLMVIIDQTAKGVSKEQAVLAAHHALLDYSDVSPSVRYLRNAPVGAPFITFSVKALGNLIETMIQHPMRFAPYAAIPFIMTQWFAASADVDKEDVEKLQETLSERMRTSGSVYFLPYKDENGRWQTMDIGYYFPYTQWVDALQHGLKGDAFKAAESFGLLGGPLPDIITAVKTGIDPFTDKPIADPRDPPAVQIGAILNYAWRLAMPTFLTNFGVLSPDFQALAVGNAPVAGKLAEAITGKVDRQSGLQKTTISQALLRLVGANINPIDPTISRANNIKIMQRSIQDSKSRLTYLLRDPSLTPEQRKNLSEAYRNEILERSKDLGEYVKSSAINPKITDKSLTNVE